MKSPKVFFAGNLKFLRERRKLTQHELSEKLGITRVRLNSLENGHTKSPQPEDYITISDFFKVSIDPLIRVDLSRTGELELRRLEAEDDRYATGGNLRILAITVNTENKENVEYVPVKAKAGYQAGYKDPEYIASLPKLSLPGVPAGTFRVFPITGDSMLPVPEDSDITGKYVEDWKSLRPKTPCIVVLRNEQNIVFKLLTVMPDGTVLLESMNPAYQPYQVPAEEILEVWKFYSFASKTFPGEQADAAELMRIILKELRGLGQK